MFDAPVQCFVCMQCVCSSISVFELIYVGVTLVQYLVFFNIATVKDFFPIKTNAPTAFN